MAKRIALVRESASVTIAGYQKFAVSAVRRIVRLQERRRKVKRELKAINDELRVARQQLRAATSASLDDATLDTPLPKVGEAS